MGLNSTSETALLHSKEPLGRDAFITKLQAIGATSYHDQHPFHLMMHAGELSASQLRAWVANRYYYQAMVPRKDACILQKAQDPHFRRVWRQRLIDQDGDRARHGGLHGWLRLAGAVGLEPNEVMSFRHVLPAVRFAVDAYLHFVQEHTLLEAVASSLTELFAPALHARRLGVFAEHYPWVDQSGLDYFAQRVEQSPVDSEFGLAYVVDHCATAQAQARALSALQTKCHILWSVLDAIHFAYVSPAWLPPGWPTQGVPHVHIQ